MKSLLSKTTVIAALSLLFFSFTTAPGGEGFEISLNNKVILQQYGKDMETVKNLQLPQVSPDDKLIVKYHHCGRVGKNRVITIKDGQNNTLKEFHFVDATTPVSAMQVKMKDIVNLKKGSTLKLYYTSSELPNGRILASLNTTSNNLTKL